MSTGVLLTIYCVLILLASLAGGLVPLLVRLTHRWMQLAVSFVAGVMLGVALLHMLPHALHAVDHGGSVASVMHWMLAGLLAMFFVERFFCFHHHDVPGEEEHYCEEGEGKGTVPFCSEDYAKGDRPRREEGGQSPFAPKTAQKGTGPGHVEAHHHDLTWSGAALGLSLHSVMNGVALAASVHAEGVATRLAGMATFLVIFLHKPFDSLTLGMLMAKGGWPVRWRHAVNGLFALAIPLGAIAFELGVSVTSVHSNLVVSYALAFSAGTFLCISMSDLLPELQFHQHDRGKLSAALLLGLLTAYTIGLFEG